MPRTSEPQRLMLDTHVWIWLVSGADQLRAAAREMIGRVLSRGNVGIAVMTVWEIAQLAARNRLALGMPTLQWVEQAIASSGVPVEPLTPQIAVACNELPDPFHRDPADQMIVATARVTNAVLMTRDRRILDYAARGHLTTIAV
jgi:PIN domain nuclease of toxin-antitoxin system